jgi:hypothetical protein
MTAGNGSAVLSRGSRPDAGANRRFSFVLMALENGIGRPFLYWRHLSPG